LTREGYSSSPELNTKALFVHALKQSRTEDTVNLYC
jgi:hypothetical protein